MDAAHARSALQQLKATNASNRHNRTQSLHGAYVLYSAGTKATGTTVHSSSARFQIKVGSAGTCLEHQSLPSQP